MAVFRDLLLKGLEKMREEVEEVNEVERRGE